MGVNEACCLKHFKCSSREEMSSPKEPAQSKSHKRHQHHKNSQVFHFCDMNLLSEAQQTAYTGAPVSNSVHSINNTNCKLDKS